MRSLRTNSLSAVASSLMAIFIVAFAMISSSASAQCVWKLANPMDANADTIIAYGNVGDTVWVNFNNRVSRFGITGVSGTLNSSDPAVAVPADSVYTATQTANSGGVSAQSNVVGPDLNFTLYSATEWNTVAINQEWGRAAFIITGAGIADITSSLLVPDDISGPMPDEAASVCQIVLDIRILTPAIVRNYNFTLPLGTAQSSTFYASGVTCTPDPMSGQVVVDDGFGQVESVLVPNTGNVVAVRTQSGPVDIMKYNTTDGRVAAQLSLPGAPAALPWQLAIGDRNNDGLITSGEASIILSDAADFTRPAVTYIYATGNDPLTATFSATFGTNCIPTGTEFIALLVGDFDLNNTPVSVSMKTSESNVLNARPDENGNLHVWYNQPAQDIVIKMTNTDQKLGMKTVKIHPAFTSGIYSKDGKLNLSGQWAIAATSSTGNKVQTSFENPIFIVLPEPSGAVGLPADNFKVEANIDNQTPEFVFNNTTSIEDQLSQAKNLKMYPNPTSDVLSISIENSSINWSSISADKMPNILIMDMYGRQVLEHKMSNSNVTEVDLSKLSSGLYTVTIPGTSVFSKVMKR